MIIKPFMVSLSNHNGALRQAQGERDYFKRKLLEIRDYEVVLIYLSCAWLAGIILGTVSGIPPLLIACGLVHLSLLFFTRRYLKAIILAALCIAVLFGGAWHSRSSLPENDDTGLRYYNGAGAVELKGLVGSDPEPGEKTVGLRFEAGEIKLGGEWREVSGTAMLYLPRYAGYGYGDELLVKGELETPPRFEDFDYESYLAGKDIYSVAYYPEVRLLDTGKGLKPLEWIYSLRNGLSGAISEILPEPQASLAQGVILGRRGNIPQEVRTDFARTGTAHLLAISGLHLSIVAGMMMSLGIALFGRRRYIYVWLALGTVWLYAVFTGMHPPVIRAAIMASVFLFAELLGRQRSAATALAFAAAVMAGISPHIIRDVSFQMSFAAMSGLIFVFPPVQTFLRKAVGLIPSENGALVAAAGFVADSLAVSIGAITAVLPLIAYYFGIISPAAPLATLFALPALPGAIFAGAMAAAAGLVYLPAGQVIAWLAWIFLTWILRAVGLFTAFPYIEGNFDVRLVWIYYAALIPLVWLADRWNRRIEREPASSGFTAGLPLKRLVAPLLIAAVLVFSFTASLPDDNLRVSFLDVGQGDAVLIQRGSRQILVDGGPDTRKISLALGEKMPFWDREIDMVVLTHPSADHVTGLTEVLKRYRVKKVLYPVLEFDSAVYGEFLRLIDERGIDYTPAVAGQRIDFNGAVMEVLNPQTRLLTGTQSDIDNNGIVLRLETGRVSFLLTADIMSEAELDLVYRRAVTGSTVLKVAHHGSLTSTSGEFLAVVNPAFAVIQAGEDNEFGHPEEEVLRRLEAVTGEGNIYRTDENGTVEFITDGERLWVEAESR